MTRNSKVLDWKQITVKLELEDFSRMGVRTRSEGFYSIGDLCYLLGIPECEMEDLLEGKYCPDDLKTRPGSGNYRRLTRAQAFNLGVIFAFKGLGFGLPISTHYAKLMRKEMPFAKRVLCGDPGFRPFEGCFDATGLWFAEFKKLVEVRLKTDVICNRHIAFYENNMYYSGWVAWEEIDWNESDRFESCNYKDSPLITFCMNDIILKLE